MGISRRVRLVVVLGLAVKVGELCSVEDALGDVIGRTSSYELVFCIMGIKLACPRE